MFIFQANAHFSKKVPKGTEAACIMVGQVDFLDEPVMALVRLQQSCVLTDITEVDIPTKFVFVVLGPADSPIVTEYEEMGRAMATMFTDKVLPEFHLTWLLFTSSVGSSRCFVKWLTQHDRLRSFSTEWTNLSTI